MRLTSSQLRHMRQAMADGGELVMSGVDVSRIDPTRSRPRRDIVAQLHEMGYLSFPVGLLHDTYKVTDKARAAHANNEFNTKVNPQALRVWERRCIAAAVAEYELKPSLALDGTLADRRGAIRGMMVRLNLYHAFIQEVENGREA